MNRTLTEWDDLEASKIRELGELKANLRMVAARRADLLIAHGEIANDESTQKLEQTEIQMRQLSTQIEAIEFLLKAIPERRNYSQAAEIETVIKSLRGHEQGLIDAAKKIDKAAETFALAVRGFYDVLQSFAEIDKYVNYRSIDIGALNSIGVFLRKYDLWKFIKVGHFRDADTMTNGIKNNPAIKQIASLEHRMSESVRLLRGEQVEVEYCPNCFGRIIFGSASPKSYTDIKVCKSCGKEFNGFVLRK